MSNSNAKRKISNNQTRETIAKVYHYLKRDAKDIINIINDPRWAEWIGPGSKILNTMLNDHLGNVRKRTALAVGVSERTITNILAEEREFGGKFKTPFENRKKLATKSGVDNYDVDVIHSIIQNYSLENTEPLKLIELKKLFKEKLNFNGSISSLRRILFKLGYRWTTRDKKRILIIEPRGTPAESKLETKIG